VKHRLGAAVAVTALILAAGSPLAAHLLFSAAAPGYLAKIMFSEPGTQGRPASMGAFAPTDQRVVLANARDNRWTSRSLQKITSAGIP
jgi:hypothetical protein